VSGTLVIGNKDRNLLSYCMDIYLHFEIVQKKFQSVTGSIIGTHGPLYALRKAAFERIPENISSGEDLFLPLKILEKGYRVVYENQAIAIGTATKDIRVELRRKIRIAACVFRCFGYFKSLLSPARGMVAFNFWSHRILRYFSPLGFILLLIGNLFLLEYPFYRLVLGGQILFYGAAFVGAILSFLDVKRKQLLLVFACLAWYITISNVGGLLGLWQCLTGTQKMTWDVQR